MPSNVAAASEKLYHDVDGYFGDYAKTVPAESGNKRKDAEKHAGAASGGSNGDGKRFLFVYSFAIQQQ